MVRKIRYSVVIPTFNDDARLSENLPGIMAWARERKDVEVIVVDDGSNEMQASFIKDVCEENVTTLYRYEENKGKWFAIRYGVERAVGDSIIICDADASVHPSDVVDAFANRKASGPCVFVGERVSPDTPLHRRLFGFLFHLATSLILGDFLPNDTQAPGKLIPRDVKLWGKLREDGFAGDVEMLVVFSKKYPLYVEHVPYRMGKDSKVRPVRDGWRMLLALFRIRRRHLIG